MRVLAILVAMAAAAWIFGTPHLRIEYACTGFRGACQSYVRCEYLGVEGWRSHNGPSCPIVRLFPIKYLAFSRS